MLSGSRKLRGRHRTLGDRLLSDGLIDEAQLRQALERQKRTGEFLGETLVSLGFVQVSQIGTYLEAVTGFPFVDLSGTNIDFEEARKIKEGTARETCCVPFEKQNGSTFVAMADPLNLTAVDEIRLELGTKIVPYLAFASDVEDCINRVFSVSHKAQSVISEIAPVAAFEEISTEALLGLAEDAPIVRLVNSIIDGALSQEASDIHIEPNEENVRVRYRIDGLLHEQMTLPSLHLAATVSRLKIMANLDIAERRRPQDGRFSAKSPGGREYDIRMSLMPTIYGEKVVMRLLEKVSQLGSLDRLGFFPDQRKMFDKMLARPHGIILVTGPTGSGKSTTLFAALQKINTTSINISTVEDPVEYRIPGVNQVQVNAKIGVTFAGGLRTLVRQDPDVILVGEIRDSETAEIAVQAALTGHLVLSTLHTNDAPGALVRLQNMGIEPFLISSSVLGVVGQRLLRCVCPSCRHVDTVTPDLARSLGVPQDEAKHFSAARGKGCSRCSGRGMKGRTAAYEIMPMTDSIRELVLARASGVDIMDKAREEGMATMRESGLRKVRELTVAPEEMIRVLSEEDSW